MSNHDTNAKETRVETRREGRFDAETFKRLVDEGQRLAEKFDRDSASMRRFTPDDLRVRSR
jgi:hypothetical protein